ncbi:hypothetical protein T06_441 [Trichinella sp. T6]|nr:hypothetical protein T06_441 [Trichinella sp. T6]
MNNVLKCSLKTEVLEHVIINLKPNKQLFYELTNLHLCLHRLCMLRPVPYNYTALTIKQTRKCLFERSTSY